MSVKLIKVTVGPWPMNAYIIIDKETNTSAIVDPGAEPETLLSKIQDTRVSAILVTHGHSDHVGALNEVMDATTAPVYMNPEEADSFKLPIDLPLKDGQILPIGQSQLRAIHTPGHTPGMTCLDLGDGRILVGDTIFVGGPGKTWSRVDFATTMRTMQEIIFARPGKSLPREEPTGGLTGGWPDETRFYPGHGPSGTIGQERPAFEAFAARGWPRNLHGDVTWE
jgi:glyoxylase-like metal-dependent hydrolase (beta-lactamase superfamily II)